MDPHIIESFLHPFGIKIEVVPIVDVEEVVIFITEIHLIIEITTKTNNNKIDVLMVNYRHNITSSNRKKDSKELLEDHITSRRIDSKDLLKDLFRRKKDFKDLLEDLLVIDFRVQISIQIDNIIILQDRFEKMNKIFEVLLLLNGKNLRYLRKEF